MDFEALKRIFYELVLDIGISGVSIWLCVQYVGKALIKRQMDKDLELYKSQLSDESEKLKSHLSIYAHALNVGISRLDQQRAKAIQEIYSIITEWHESLIEICANRHEDDMEPPESIFQTYCSNASQLIEISERLSKQVRHYAILFSDDSYKRIADYGNNLSSIACDFSEEKEKLVHYRESYSAITSCMGKIIDKIEDNSKKRDDLRETLLAEFRMLMTANKPR